MFKYVQWAVFLLIFLPFMFSFSSSDPLVFKLFVSFLFATIGTFVFSLFGRPVWDMFAGMLGREE